MCPYLGWSRADVEEGKGKGQRSIESKDCQIRLEYNVFYIQKGVIVGDNSHKRLCFLQENILQKEEEREKWPEQIDDHNSQALVPKDFYQQLFTVDVEFVI